MADGYLEKKFVDYEKRKAEWERRKRLGLSTKNKLSKTNTNKLQ